MSIDLSALTAVQLDELLVAAAKRRAELAPPPDMQPPAQCDAIVNPAWHTGPIPTGMLFMLRHPGLGWLGFALPHEHRVHLATLWLHQSMLYQPAARSRAGGGSAGAAARRPQSGQAAAARCTRRRAGRRRWSMRPWAESRRAAVSPFATWRCHNRFVFVLRAHRRGQSGCNHE